MTASGDSAGRQRFAHRRLTSIATSVVLEDSAGTALDSAVVERFFIAPGVQQSVVGDDGLRAHFFTPARTPAPGILVLGGSEGGYPDDVAAILASNGFATLSLAYFGVDDLPSELAEIPLEYFERALAWLRANPAVARDRIALVGTSKGAEAALLVASRVSGVKAVVAYAPSSVAWFCICQSPRPSWSAKGEHVVAVPPGTDPSYRPGEGDAIRPVVNYLYRLRRTPRRAVIPVERIAAPLLLVAGDEDQLWPSLLMARAIMERRAERGRHPSDELLVYPGAGHLIGKAYVPAGSTRIAGGRIETGGSPQANARAQADAWPRVLAFLRKALE
jgi:dienelactone hydrolase